MNRQVLNDVHVVVRSHVRRVEIARRRFDAGGGESFSITFAEVRGDRRFQVSIPQSALDDAIEALCALRASVVAEHGPGSSQRRGAPMHGTWMPTDDGAPRRSGRSE